MIDEIIDKYIRFIRQTYSTQTEAADELNISRSHLSKIIHKKDNPSLTLLQRMERVMKNYGYEE